MTARTAPLAAILLAAALLAACAAEQDPDALTPAQAAEADALLRDYESARAGKNWTAAEALGEKLRTRFPESDAATTMRATLEAVQREAEGMREAQRLEQAWTYQAVAAAGGTQRSAALDSRTPLVEEGEVPLPADARLVLRDHPEWGRSSYLLLEQKDFACGSPCRLRIGFDDAAATSWAGKQADSGQGPALFIEDEARFVPALDAARAVHIELPAGSGRLKTLHFDVAGFRAERYASP